MHRAFSVAMTAALALLVAGPLGAPLASAQSDSIDAWIEVATNRPGVGCAVDVSAEVHSGGAGLSGADVSVVVSDDDSGEVISSDTSTANESGIAWLVIDTSGAAAGAKTWMSVSVNGAYVGGQTIWVTADGSCSGSSTILDLSGEVPSISGNTAAPDEADSGATDESSSDSGGQVMIPGAFTYQQERGLSCEYASLAIATGMLGDWVSEYEFEAAIPLSDNPHWGYRGDITGSWGNTTNYGIYPEALVPALQQYGFQGDVFYGGRGDLTAQIDLGRPTLVWIGMQGDSGSFYDYTADGTRFQLTPYMHVMVAYGYDDWGIYLSDPGTGVLRSYDWGTFEWMWDTMDGMSLAVHW